MLRRSILSLPVRSCLSVLLPSSVVPLSVGVSGIDRLNQRKILPITSVSATVYSKRIHTTYYRMASDIPASAGTSGELPAPIQEYFGSVSPTRLSELESCGPLRLNHLLQLGWQVATGGPSSEGKRRIHLIFGNEGGDMDSMVSSIVLSWYLTSIHPPSTGNFFIPMMNMERGELRLRGEAGWAFQQAGLDASLLLFKEDLSPNFERFKSQGELCALLVDHNQLEAAQCELKDHVVALIDHHKDEGLYPRTFQGGPGANRILMPQGSCTTLLADMILRNASVLLSPKNLEKEIDYKTNATPTVLGIVRLLTHVCLLDTSNFSKEAKKALDIDVRVYEQYKHIVQEVTHAELKRRRADISQLGIKDLLAKDTKYGESLKYPHFIASIPSGLHDLVSKDGGFMLPIIESYAREKNLRFVIILTSHTHGQFKREVTLIVLKDREKFPPPAGTIKAEELFERLSQELVEAGREKLALVPDDSLLPEHIKAIPHGLLVRTFRQENLAGSRKQVAPLVEGLLSKL